MPGWDAQGNELAKIIERFAESDDTRLAVGSTAIPYGACVEPSNVAALGSACPYRMRCIGCKHFRTDLTHLAALEKYLTDLLAARERILAASDELAGWAKRAAMPSDEITTCWCIPAPCESIAMIGAPSDSPPLPIGWQITKRHASRLGCFRVATMLPSTRAKSINSSHR